MDMNRRKAVMSRSRKLGHCVCNPKQPCPCEDLIKYNVCPCAGERLPRREKDVKLTRHVKKAGCASKIGQADLNQVLSKLPAIKDPRVLLGTAAGDDAGIFEMDEKYCLVQTVDVFTPLVDDPFLFGQIAAANSLSDVYAMGGKPLTALSIVGFPIDELEPSLLEALIKGGMEKLEEAGCPLIGGHSMNDEEIKCGFAITGIIHKDKVVQRDRARPGDVLVLTKPLGTGMVGFASQLGRIKEEYLEEIGRWMAMLNKDASEIMVRHNAHACTDVTGFGLAGHLVQMAMGSNVAAEIQVEKLPVFRGAEECMAEDVLPGAVDRNQAYSMGWIITRTREAEKALPILFDPQTSGGLLIAFNERDAEKFIQEMKSRGHEAASIIGRILEPGNDIKKGNLILTGRGFENLFGSGNVLLPKPAAEQPEKIKIEKEGEQEDVLECCPGGPPGTAETREEKREPETVYAFREPKKETEGSMKPGEVEGIFKNFMAEANKEGLIDARTKKLMGVALAIANHCEPCLKSFLKGAVSMGITKEELDEAANLATEFGGCTAMMFYKEVCKELGIQ